MNIKIYKRLDSASFTAIPDHRGRVTIPASIRRKMGVRATSIVLVDIKRGDECER